MPYIPPHRRKQLLAQPTAGAGAASEIPAPAARPLLVLDVNNVLLCRKPYEQRNGFGPQYQLRRHCNEFVRFCLEHYQVAVWSCGRRDTLMAEMAEIEALQGDAKNRLLFVWWQDHSTNLWPRHSAVSEKKPLFLKEIGKIWRHYPQYGPANTILIDDHIEKFEKNPLGSCIVVPAFYDGASHDDCLSVAGELVGWLRRLAHADDTMAMIRACETQTSLFPVAHPLPASSPDAPPHNLEPELGPEPEPGHEPEPEPETHTTTSSENTC